MLQILKRLFFVATVAAVPTAGFAEPLDVLGGPFVRDLLDAAAAGFMEEEPHIEIQVSTGPRSDDDLLQDILRLSTVGAPLPDVVVTGSGLRLLAERGIAVDLTPFVEANPNSILASASPTVLEKGRVGSRYFGVGFGLSMQTVLFNNDLVAKAGGNPSNLPKDWSGILALAKDIDKLGSPVVGGFIEADNTGSLSLLSLLQAQGGRFMDQQERNLSINTPQGIAALNILRGFGEAGQASAVMTRDQARQAFGAGTIGVFATMSSTIAAHEKAARGIFTIGSVPLPAVDGGTIPTAGPIAIILSKDRARQEAAIKFAEFLIGPKGQTILVQNSGYLPVNEKAIQGAPELQALLAAQPNYTSVTARLPVAVGWFEPPGDNPARIATIVNQRLFDVVTLKSTPAVALEALSKAIKPLLPSP